MSKKVLCADAKTYIVSRLACWARPVDVIREVKEQWKISLTSAALAHYNPTTFQGRELAESLKAMFYEIRAAYVAGVQDVAIAHQRHRLEQLNRIAEQAEVDGAMSLALAANKAAREETSALARGADADAPGTAPGDCNPKEFHALVDELKQRPNAELELVELYNDLL